MRTASPYSTRLSALVVSTLVVACVLLGAPGAATASSAAPSADPSAAKTMYRVGVLEYVDSLNPFIGYSGVDYLVYHLNYDFLVGFEPEKLQPRPEYAESWSSSA